MVYVPVFHVNFPPFRDVLSSLSCIVVDGAIRCSERTKEAKITRVGSTVERLRSLYIVVKRGTFLAILVLYLP